MQEILFSGDGSLVLPPNFGDNENIDRCHPMNSIYFLYIFDTPKREVVKNENHEMIWKEKNADGGEYFVGYA